MKAQFSLLILTSILFTIGCHQKKYTSPELILDFEIIEKGMPRGWIIHKQHGYSVSLDSMNVKSGKYSIAIEFTENYRYAVQTAALVFPNNYNGEKITLSGYIKTKNVDGGFAGLAMQIGSKIAIEWMDKKGRLGTTDWEKYEVTLDMESSQNQQITVGAIFGDKGKMWMDDLQVTIDGKNIGKVKPYTPKPFSDKAKNDKEFDKGSNIVFPELNEQKIADLELLGRIWGFLKYHHPAIAKGNYNWDYELFRVLPDYLKASNHQQRDKILIKWVGKYGRIPNCKTCQPTSGDAVLKPDLSWIENSSINRKLNNLLHKIYLNRNQGPHYYIRMTDFVGNPMFTNEKDYVGSDHCPDAGIRLLALYRYWNMIHYFSSNKHLTDKDWNTVLKEYIPYFIEGENRLEYELAAVRLIGEICDSHAVLIGFSRMESFKGYGRVPANVKFVENKLVVTEYFGENTGLKKGDVITHIDGRAIEAIVDSMKKYYPASNEAAKLRDIAGNILRSNKQYLHISDASSGKTGQYAVSKRKSWYNPHKQQDTTRSYRFIDKGIGYINLKIIKSEDLPAIKQAFMNAKGIIIDIRNYPPSYAAYMLGSFFVSGNTPIARLTVGNSDNPGEFTLGLDDIIPKLDNSYQGKLVVIVNEDTQSQAEFTAMALRAGSNTTTIGSQTAGADGNISKIDLPGGLTTWISGNGVYYPDGCETQRIGIVPDIEVKPTIKGIREERDELLEKAIEIIRRE